MAFTILNNILTARLNTPILLISISYFIIFIGQSVWRISLPSFAVEVLYVTPVQLGIIFSFSSLPGLLSLTIGFVHNNIRLSFLILCSFIFVGAGLLVTSVATSWSTLLVGAISIHIGIAIYYPTANTEYIVQENKEKTIQGLSMLKSLAPLGSTTTSVIFLIYIIMIPFGYVSLLISTGVFVLVAGVAYIPSAMNRNSEYKQDEINFKKEHWPFYILNFLNGCRSGIFRTFVPFNLITQHGFGFKETASLILIGSFMTFIGYQLIGYFGSIVNPIRLLRLIYAITSLNFLGFWLIESPHYLAVIFLIDALLFCSSSITDSYLKYKYHSEEILAHLASGVSLYHLGGVIMPLIGGLLYHINGNTIFILGSVFALLSFFSSKYLNFS